MTTCADSIPMAQQIPGKNPAHHRSLLRIDFRPAVRSPPVAEEAFVVVVDLPVLEVLAVAPLHIPAEGFALRLGLAHHKGENHLIVHIERVHIFLFKVHAYTVLFQAAHIVQPVQCVAAEPGHRLGDDQIDLPLLAVPYHLQEVLALPGRGAGDPLIRIQAHHGPVRIGVDLVGIVFDLRLIAG